MKKDLIQQMGILAEQATLFWYTNSTNIQLNEAEANLFDANNIKRTRTCTEFTCECTLFFRIKSLFLFRYLKYRYDNAFNSISIIPIWCRKKRARVDLMFLFTTLCVCVLSRMTNTKCIATNLFISVIVVVHFSCGTCSLPSFHLLIIIIILVHTKLLPSTTIL